MFNILSLDSRMINEISYELLLLIFSFLPEKIVYRNRKVCRLWRDMAGDRYLLWTYPSSMHCRYKFLDCCRHDRIFTLEKIVQEVTDISNKWLRVCSTHALWDEGMIEASTFGSILVLQKVLSYGPCDGFVQAFFRAVENDHTPVVRYLHYERNFPLSLLQKSLTYAKTPAMMTCLHHFIERQKYIIVK
jgi:hypothetical protein